MTIFFVSNPPTNPVKKFETMKSLRTPSMTLLYSYTLPAMVGMTEEVSLAVEDFRVAGLWPAEALLSLERMGAMAQSVVE